MILKSSVREIVTMVKNTDLQNLMRIYVRFFSDTLKSSQNLQIQRDIPSKSLKSCVEKNLLMIHKIPPIYPTFYEKKQRNLNVSTKRPTPGPSPKRSQREFLLTKTLETRKLQRRDGTIRVVQSLYDRQYEKNRKFFQFGKLESNCSNDAIFWKSRYLLS